MSAEHEFALRLDTRVDELGERLAKIEGGMNTERPKNVWQLLSGLGALVAFCLSLATSIYTVHNNFVAEPRKEREERATALAKERQQQEVNFRNDVTSLAELVARIAGLDWVNNQQAANAQAGLLSPQRYALRDRIMASDTAMPNVLGFADRLLLTNELEFAGMWQKALEHTAKLHTAATNPGEKAYAHWAEARIHGGLNQLDAMRTSFTEAVAEFKAGGMSTYAGWVMQVYLQWVSLELVRGTCDTASPVHARMLADFNTPDVWDTTKQAFVPQYNLMLFSAQRKCGLILDMPALTPG
jgi:hypothetical protein